jgi:lysyl-tRNA synthetase class 2
LIRDAGDRAAAVRLRSDLIAGVREFFRARGVMEVQTPLVTASGVTDVHIDSTPLADGGYLRTSPEYAHKRLLAAGAGDLYELGAVFRRGERGRHHRPEFTLLEWYRLGWGWRELADETVALIESLMPDRRWTVSYIRWNDLVARHTGTDYARDGLPGVRAAAADAPHDLDEPELLDWLFASRVQPALPTDAITVVHHYPAIQAALARRVPGDPAWAERFEVFAGPVELANGYRELTDAGEQRARFEADNRRRAALGRPRMPVDENLLAALAAGLPECAGVAVGFDRLAMIAAGVDELAGIELFDDDA